MSRGGRSIVVLLSAVFCMGAPLPMKWAQLDATITGITFGPSGFVAIGSAAGMGSPSTVFSSSDGLAWKLSEGSEHNSQYDVEHAFGRYIFGSEMRVLNGVLFRGGSISTNGVDWGIVPEAHSLHDLIFGKGAYFGISASDVLISPDLKEWRRFEISTNSLRRIAFGNDVFVAFASSNVVGRSVDGTSWDWVTVPAARLRSLDYLFDRFVVTGDEGQIFTSTNGSDWRLEETGVEIGLRAAAYGNGRFVAAGEQGTILVSQGDGKWELARNAPTTYGTALTADGDRLIALGRTNLFVTTNGALWTERIVGHLGSFNSMARSTDRYVIVGDEGKVAVSDDLENWTGSEAPAKGGLKAVCFGEGKFVAGRRGRDRCHFAGRD